MNINKHVISNFILFSFILISTGTVMLSELFQAPVKNSIEVIQNLKLFKQNELTNIVKIKLKNKSGDFYFELKNQSISPWQMISPRTISANSLFFEKLFQLLKENNIKKIYTNDKINSSNFLLDKSTTVITLIDSLGKEILIDVGLQNSIDNSIYLKVSTKNAIYHLEAPAITLESANLIDLIESKIFNFEIESLAHIQIFKGKKNTQQILDISKDKDGWKENKSKHIEDIKLKDYLSELSSIKSAFILDQQTNAQKNLIISNSKKPEYSIIVEDKKGKTIEYTISGPVYSFPELDLKNEAYFIITLVDESTAYVTRKSYFETFLEDTNSLKN